jgi:hypothetical protein
LNNETFTNSQQLPIIVRKCAEKFIEFCRAILEIKIKTVPHQAIGKQAKNCKSIHAQKPL